MAATEDTREENPGAHALIVAARGSLAKSSTVVEKRILFHEVYKKPNGKLGKAFTRLLVAQVDWHAPMAGKSTLRVLNVHLHHLVAKQVIDAQIS